ncbi:MAG: hypothetical protein ACKVZJ_05670 [Phycisphaerales bacterium]
MNNLPCKTKSDAPASPVAAVVQMLWFSRVGRAVVILVGALGIFSMAAAAVPQWLVPNAFYIRDLFYSPRVTGDLRIYNRQTTCDLRGWRRVPKDMRATRKSSRALWTNSFTMERTGDNPSRFYVHAPSTSSEMPMDIYCDSHPYRITGPKNPRAFPPNHRGKQVWIDISEEPINQQFTAHFMATMWNSFQDSETQNAMFKVERETARQELTVIFPANKPGKLRDLKQQLLGSEEFRSIPRDEIGKLSLRAFRDGKEVSATQEQFTIIVWVIDDQHRTSDWARVDRYEIVWDW